MNNIIFQRLLSIINNKKEEFNTLVEADNINNLNVTSEEVINYLEFTTNELLLKGPIVGNIIITEGDVLSILKIIHDLVNYEGEYLLYINDDNIGTITYLITLANKIYEELNLNIKITLDYGKNYNKYLNELVTIIGSNNFVETASHDFTNTNLIIM